MSWTTLPRSELTPVVMAHRTGEGPPLLLVHGVGMRAEFWSALVPPLRKHFSLTVPDLPGHGESPRLSDGRTRLTAYGDALIASLGASPRPWIVVGHSLGALIALDMAVRYPRRVSGIAVLNGVHRRPAEALRAVRARAAELSDTTPLDHTSTLARWFGETPAGGDAEAADACARWLHATDRVGYRDAYRTFAESDTPPDTVLRAIHARALMVTGSLEPNSTPAMSRAMSELIPDARCLVLEGARHMLPMTHADILSDALLERFREGAMRDD